MTVSRTAGALAALAGLLAALLVTALVTGVVALPSGGTPGTSDGGASSVEDAGTTGLPASTLDGSAEAAPAAPQDGEVTVELLDAVPAVARPGDSVALTARVTNGRDTALEGADVDLGVHWRPVSSRDDLAAWAEDDSTTVAAEQLSEPVDRIAPGKSTRVRLTLQVDILDLGSDAAWGPREMSLAVMADGTPLDVLHTFLLFAPDGATPDPVGVSVVAPVTGPPVDALDAEAYASDLAGLTADGGRLAALADAGTPSGASPGVSLAADPALVAAASASADTATAAWATRLTDGSAPDVAALPAFDPDLGALAHADLSAGETAAATGADAVLPGPWQTPEAWDITLAWPQGRPDVATMAAARAASVDHVLVSDGLSPRAGAAASARTAVATPSGKVSALVADEQLSDVVAGITTDADATPTETAQRLLADTALLAMQQGAAGDEGQAGVHVLAALPRGWTPDVAALHQVLEALDAADWSDVVPLAETIDTPATDTPRADLPDNDVDDAELAPSAVRALADAHRSVTSFATVAADPVELAGSVQRSLALPLAVAYRDDPEARDTAVSSAVARADDLRQGITVADRDTVTLISDSGDLPVLVRNDLDVDATVTVVLRPDDPRLKVETRPTVVIPAGQSSNVPVQVRAIGSGNVEIEVEVLAPSGASVAEPADFAVRVRAGWETVGTAVVAAAIGVLFVAGIWRTVRRGRSPRRTTGEVVGPVVEPPTPPAGIPTAATPGADTPPVPEPAAPAESPAPTAPTAPPENDRA
ncbi:DUF6049 family protein [Isoptericola hypogeus]|uniref:DUF6049 family protein n=1 Tax=Isoptericola hypogeus TaxID=300179 RepID=UPI0031D68A84